MTPLATAGAALAAVAFLVGGCCAARHDRLPVGAAHRRALSRTTGVALVGFGAGMLGLVLGLIQQANAAHDRQAAALHARYGISYLTGLADGLDRLRLADGTVATCSVSGPDAAPVVRCLGAPLPAAGPRGAHR